MNPALKGVVLSGLVYPGFGQIAQRHYARGAVLLGVVTASLAVTVYAAVQQASAMLARLAEDGGAVDVTTLLRESNAASGGNGGRIMTVSSLLIAACWVVGVVDAYLCGKRIAPQQGAESRAP